MSRYVERAQNAARLVDVNLRLILNVCNLNDAAIDGYWQPIVESTGDGELVSRLYPRLTGSPHRHCIARRRMHCSGLRAVVLWRPRVRAPHDSGLGHVCRAVCGAAAIATMALGNEEGMRLLVPSSGGIFVLGIVPNTGMSPRG